MVNLREYLKNRKAGAKDEFDAKIQAHRRKVRLRTALITAAVLIAAVAGYIYFTNRYFETYELEEIENITGGSSSGYYKYADGILAYSDDGISYIKNGEVIWNQAFEMKQPILDMCLGTVAIADMSTDVIYVYDESGQLGKINTTYPVIEIDVSEQGVVAAITQDSDTNRIEIYDKDSNVIAAGQTYITGEGCPVDLSISEDGTKLAVSYIYIEGGVSMSKVVFYNYSEVGKNEVSRIVGGFNRNGGEIVSRVEFLDNDTVAAFSGENVVIYSMKQKPSIQAQVDLDETVRSIFYSSDYVGVVCNGTDLKQPYHILVYDLNGAKKMDYSTDFIYTGVEIDDDRIVLYNSCEMVMMNMSGRIRFDCVIDEGIEDIITTGNSKKYYLVDSAFDIRQMKLK